ncbi:hypothetical protein VTN02DRAFT_6091 [Thermoascus thermophilus]
MLFGTSLIAALALAAAPAAAGNRDFHHQNEPAAEVTTITTTAPIITPTGHYPVIPLPSGGHHHPNGTGTGNGHGNGHGHGHGNSTGTGTTPGHYGNWTTLTGPNGQPTATLPVGEGGVGVGGVGSGVGSGAIPPVPTASGGFLPANPGSKIEVAHVAALALSALCGAFVVMA